MTLAEGQWWKGQPDQTHNLEILEPRLLMAGDLGPSLAPLADNNIAGARSFGVLDADSSAVDSLDRKDRKDFYQFTLEETTSVAITLDGLANNANVALRDGPGRRAVVASSKAKGNRAELITETLSPGTYYIVVSGGRRTDTTYELNIEADSPGAIDTNGTKTSGANDNGLGPTVDPKADNEPGNARTFGVLGETGGNALAVDSLEKGDLKDYYHFSLTETRAVGIQLDNLQSNANLVLMDGNDTRKKIAVSKKRGTADELITRDLAPGSYLISVSGGRKTQTDYRLQVVTGAPFTDPTDQFDENDNGSLPSADANISDNDTPDTAIQIGELSGRRVFNESVGTLDGDDWYVFVLPERSDLEFRLDNLNDDVDFEIFDLAIDRVRLSRVKDPVTDEIIRTAQNEGIYYIRVFAVDPDTADTNYRLTLNATEYTGPEIVGNGEFSIEFVVPAEGEDGEVDEEVIPLLAPAAARWERVITGDLPDVGLIDDIQILVTQGELDDDGGTWATGTPTATRANGLPYMGEIFLDEADIDADNPLYLDLLIHEIGHALGFGVGELWDPRLRNPDSDDPRYLGTHAVRELQLIFRNTEKQVPVEADGDPGQALAHWRESYFEDEIMSTFLNEPENLLSRITVGVLDDFGYEVDYTEADLYTAPYLRA